MNEVSPADMNVFDNSEGRSKLDVNKMVVTKKSLINLLIEKFEPLNVGSVLAKLDSGLSVGGVQSVQQVECMDTENGPLK